MGFTMTGIAQGGKERERVAIAIASHVLSKSQTASHNQAGSFRLLRHIAAEDVEVRVELVHVLTSWKTVHQLITTSHRVRSVEHSWLRSW